MGGLGFGNQKRKETCRSCNSNDQCCHTVHGMDSWGVHLGSGWTVHTISKKWGPWGPQQYPLYIQFIPFVCNCLPSTGKNHFFNSHLLAWHLVTGGGTILIKVTSISAPIGLIIMVFVKHVSKMLRNNSRLLMLMHSLSGPLRCHLAFFSDSFRGYETHRANMQEMGPDENSSKELSTYQGISQTLQ